MRVVYSTAHRGHDPRERDRDRPAGRRPTSAPAGPRPSAPCWWPIPTSPSRRRRTTGSTRSQAVHDPDFVAYLEQAWARVGARRCPAHRQAIPDTFPNPALRDGMGPGRPPTGAVARLSYYVFDTTTASCEAPTTRRAPRSTSPSPPRTSCWPASRRRLRAVPAARPPRAPRRVRRLLLLQQRGHRRPARGARPGPNASPCSTSTTTTATARSRSSTTAPTCCTSSLHADPNRAYPYFAGFADETGTGRGAGATLNVPLRRGLRRRRLPRRARPGARRRRRVRPRTSWSCRSASTPTGSTRSATSQVTDRRLPPGRRRGRRARPSDGRRAGGRLRRRPTIGGTCTPSCAALAGLTPSAAGERAGGRRRRAARTGAAGVR